ncbi:MAG: histidinol-phosphatase [Spirochaetaceae bacterium]|jgi:histidinol-phosphatase (PHP family)|nr:histidinol-phosphatase [Spirochaetaceae bacterium]
MTSLHTHSLYCDGADDIETLCKAAYEKGLSAIGFSSHAPLNEKIGFDAYWCMKSNKLSEYCKEVRSAKERWAGKLDVLLALEVDYIDGLCGPADEDMQKLKADYAFDYFIGSTHYVVAPGQKLQRGDSANYGKIIAADSDAAILQKGIDELFGGDGELYAEEYYKGLANMCRKGGFEIIGHFDLVKKNNDKLHFFDPNSPRYKQAAMQAVEAAAEAYRREHIIVEINTGGMNRGFTKEAYPSPAIQKALSERGVPFIVTADAHRAVDLDGGYLNTQAKAYIKANSIKDLPEEV